MMMREYSSFSEEVPRLQINYYLSFNVIDLAFLTSTLHTITANITHTCLAGEVMGNAGWRELLEICVKADVSYLFRGSLLVWDKIYMDGKL